MTAQDSYIDNIIQLTAMVRMPKHWLCTNSIIFTAKYCKTFSVCVVFGEENVVRLANSIYIVLGYDLVLQLLTTDTRFMLLK